MNQIQYFSIFTIFSVFKISTQEKFLVEISYETCHKIGGCNTVITTKASAVQRHFNDNFLMFGMSLPHELTQQTMFKEYDQNSLNNLQETQTQRVQKIFNIVREFEQIMDLPPKSCRFGRWLIQGAPLTILFPVNTRSEKINQAFVVGVDCINTTINVDCNQLSDQKEQFKRNSVSFGIYSWLFISYFLQKFILPERLHLSVQVHEWLSAAPILLFKKSNAYRFLNVNRTAPNSQISFVFTTHATTLGRHLSASGNSLEQVLNRCPSAEELDAFACEHGIRYEHRMERAAAALTDAFTCVSKQTAQECKVLLGKDVDVVTYNGLDIYKIRGQDGMGMYKGKLIEEQLKEFLQIYFYGLDLKKTSIFFTAGRYEFTNKGFDIFIDALASLRNRLDRYQSDKNVVGIIIAPDSNKGLSEHSLQIQNLQSTIKLQTQQISGQVQKQLTNLICSSKQNIDTITLDKLLDKNDLTQLTLLNTQLKYLGSYSPITTHNIVNEDTIILQRLRQHNLINQPHSKVKVLFIPEFLLSTSIFHLEYNDFLRGCDLGVFASVYEPFGYTGIECASAGCASLISNRCGAAGVVQEMKKQLGRGLSKVDEMTRILSENSIGALGRTPIDVMSTKSTTINNDWVLNKSGIEIVDRIHQSYQDSVEQMSRMMYEYLELSENEKQQLKQRMYQNSVFFDWNTQFDSYMQAYDIAESKVQY